MKTSDILIEAKSVIAKPGQWTQRNYARTADGTPTTTDDPLACSFCAAGAIHKAAPPGNHRYAAKEVLREQMRKHDGHAVTIAGFNDSHLHDSVIEVFDAAIASALANEEMPFDGRPYK